MTRSILVRDGALCKRRREEADERSAAHDVNAGCVNVPEPKQLRRERGVSFREVTEEVVGVADDDVVRMT